MTTLKDWALKQVKTVDEYLKVELQKDSIVNPLINSSFPGGYLFCIHLGIYGWPDSKDELESLLWYIESQNPSYREIINHWGVEECCVLGGYECRNRDHSTDVEPMGTDKLPFGVEDNLLEYVERFN